MAIDKAVDSTALDSALTDIADAIRTKTGGTDPLTLEQMPGEIEGIQSGGLDPGTGGYIIGDGLKLEGRRLSVDVATSVDKDNTKPITSAAVFTEIGNINALLATI